MEKNYNTFYKRWIMPVAVILLFTSNSASAFNFNEDLTKEQKLLAVDATAALLITAYGIAHWDYGKEGPSLVTEKWFSKESKDGGSDKSGHFYNSYHLAYNIAKLCKSWGYSEEEASIRGFLSSMGLMTLMEIGDSFSDYGFSREDIIMNIFGGATGYFLYRHPEIDKKIDFRVEYRPTLETTDFLTDFKRMKFLVSLKLEGFDFIEFEALKYLEFHLGYYVRGFAGEETERTRHLFVGAGINLSRVFKKLSYKRTATIFEFFQPPYTYLAVENEIE